MGFGVRCSCKRKPCSKSEIWTVVDGFMLPEKAWHCLSYELQGQEELTGCCTPGQSRSASWMPQFQFPRIPRALHVPGM